VKIVTSRLRRFPARRAAAFNGPWRGTTPQHLIFYILLAFLLTCLLGGGSNRTDVLSLLYLRPVTVVCLVAMLAVPTDWEFARVRTPLLLLGCLAALMLVQLVPLPPSIWLHLPARDQFAGAALGLDGQQPWRPISLTPDLTLNSLLALLVPLTALVGFAGIRPDQRSVLIQLAIGATVVSAVLGVAQFAGGGLNLYARNSGDVPSGVFSNRNHQAAFLDCGVVLIATWLRNPAERLHHRHVRQAIGAGLALLLFTVVIATGSRSGTLLALLACVYGAVTLARTSSGSGKPLLTRVVIVAVVLGFGGIMVFAGRAVSVDRLLGFDADAEQRIRAIPTLLTMWRELMPVGSGFGSFDPTFRVFEPDAMLHPAYFNHAHNDWLEFGLSGGLPALVLLAIFVVWVIVRAVGSFRTQVTGPVLRARAGIMILVILGGASVTDYPIRTPLMAALVALACAWLASSRREGDGPEESEQGEPRLQ
jgi:O-antigen ligase